MTKKQLEKQRKEYYDFLDNLESYGGRELTEDELRFNVNGGTVVDDGGSSGDIVSESAEETSSTEAGENVSSIETDNPSTEEPTVAEDDSENGDNGESYTVQSGDTLSEITEAYNEEHGTDYTTQEIADMNGIENPDVIHPGDEINFPSEQEEKSEAEGNENAQVTEENTELDEDCSSSDETEGENASTTEGKTAESGEKTADDGKVAEDEKEAGTSSKSTTGDENATVSVPVDKTESAAEKGEISASSKSDSGGFWSSVFSAIGDFFVEIYDAVKEIANDIYNDFTASGGELNDGAEMPITKNVSATIISPNSSSTKVSNYNSSLLTFNEEDLKQRLVEDASKSYYDPGIFFGMIWHIDK